MTTTARLAVGLASMAGFTASGGGAVVGVIGPTTTLVLMTISLGIYVGALMQHEPQQGRNEAATTRPRPPAPAPRTAQAAPPRASAAAR